MRSVWIAAILAVGPCLASCTEAVEARIAASSTTEGRAYELKDTQVWTVPDPVSGRTYEVFVSLPASYEESPRRRYPVLYITDADYGFPVIRSIARRVNLEGPMVEEFILVGLSYAVGEGGADSRRRDYTPTPNGPRGAPATAVHGQGAAYQAYLKSRALPFIEGRFRADPARRVFMGHSYGGLLGAQILFTDPTLFESYILGSPSLWFDQRHMFQVEEDYARAHRDLPANVFLYIGAYEAARPGVTRYNRSIDMVGDNAAFAARLRSRDYPGLTLSSEVVAEEDHLTVFPSGLTRGLLHVLPAR